MKLFQKVSTIVTCLLLALACSSATPPTPEPATTTTNSDTVKTPKGLEAPKERYQATWLDGSAFDSYDYKGEKILFAYFNYRNSASLPLLQTLAEFQDKQDKYHFRIIPVSVNSDEKSAVEKFLADNKISFRVLLEDANLKLASKLKVANEVSVIGLGNDHDQAFNIKKFVPNPKSQKEFSDYIKEYLHIDEVGRTKPYLGIYPKAPDFTAKTLDGKTFTLGSLRGKVVFLMFFSPRCPHCQKEIAYLKQLITPEFEKAGLAMVAMSVLDLSDETNKRMLDSLKIPENWLVVNDSERDVWSNYMQHSGFPEVFMINRDGNIQFYEEGFNESEEHAKVIEMRFRHLLGLDNPPQLSADRYNGVESCMICHEDQYASWSVTKHAHAWETLEIKGEDFNLDCAGCHSVGANQKEGWMPATTKTGEQVALVPPSLQNVQCESCHGLGGPHVGREQHPDDMQKNCLSCHTEKFSLHFDFNERVQKVNHSDKANILKMDSEQRLALLEKVSKNPHELFGSKTKYVGSDTCLSCHTETHKSWQGSAHAKAFESLKSENKTTDQNCLKCHTVGYNQPGGYQENLSKSFEGVGCESCHGPGETHVQTKKKSDIRGLGDDCPFCVIEQICLSCHDAKNDPHFNIHKGLEQIKGHK